MDFSSAFLIYYFYIRLYLLIGFSVTNLWEFLHASIMLSIRVLLNDKINGGVEYIILNLIILSR